MIDWDRLSELQIEVGPEDFDEVVELFLEEVEEILSRLRADVQHDLLEDDLHLLKGSALNLGFRQFSVLCQAGESNAANGMATQVNIPEILSCYEASKSAFLGGLANRILPPTSANDLSSGLIPPP